MTLNQHLKKFLAERCVKAAGCKTPFGVFADEFLLGYLPASDRKYHKLDLADALTELDIERGRGGSNQVFIPNLHLPTWRYIVADGQLRRAPL